MVLYFWKIKPSWHWIAPTQLQLFSIINITNVCTFINSLACRWCNGILVSHVLGRCLMFVFCLKLSGACYIYKYVWCEFPAANIYISCMHVYVDCEHKKLFTKMREKKMRGDSSNLTTSTVFTLSAWYQGRTARWNGIADR